MEEHKFPTAKRIKIFETVLSKVEHHGLLDASLIAAEYQTVLPKEGLIVKELERLRRELEERRLISKIEV